MRGSYRSNNTDKYRFSAALKDLCKNPLEDTRLIGAQLSLCDCENLLKELGYYIENSDYNGWEMDFWWYFSHETDINMPQIVVGGSGYTGDLWIAFTDRDSVEKETDICTDLLMDMISAKWKL
jgi:hypothetical protein